MKAVVKIGGKQFVVAEKETLLVDLLQEGTKELALDALLVIDGDKTTVGAPTVKGVKVTAKVVEDLVKGEKVRAIRYKAKKRVHKEMGHRQKYSKIEIVSIK
jgi:large subunit ribosomal protein L21